MTADELKGVRRVLRLMDRYLSAQNLDRLIAIDGGMWTLREMRRHVRAALNISKPQRTAR